MIDVALCRLFDVEACIPLLPQRPGTRDTSIKDLAFVLQRQCCLSIESSLLGIHLLNRYWHQKGSLTAADVTACFLIAGKYEDGFCGLEGHKLAETAHISEKDLEGSERKICIVLGFELYWPNPMNFLRWFSHEADGWNSNTRRLAKVFLAAHAFVVDDSSTPSSLKAAAALFTAKTVTKSGSWTPYHVLVTRQPSNTLVAISDCMIQIVSNSITSGMLPFGNLLTREEMALILAIPGSDTYQKRD